MKYKIVSWNCGGGCRNKFRELLDAYNDAHIYIISECEDPYFYDDEGYKRLFNNGFRIGIKTKGLAVIAREDIVIKRLDWLDNSQYSFAPVMINNELTLVATWTHPDYVEELHEYLDANIAKFNDKTIIMGDFNSSVIFDKDHRERNHTQLIERLDEIGMKPIYHFFTEEEQGKETIATYYHRRKVAEPFHIDHAFTNPEIVDYIAIAPQSAHAHWLEFSDHMPIELVIDTTPSKKQEQPKPMRTLADLRREEAEKMKPRMCICMPDGKRIRRDKRTDTFRDFIMKVGWERVLDMNFDVYGKDLITRDHPNGWYKELEAGWYVNTNMKSYTMRKTIREIAGACGIIVRVEWD